jgi:hypothetical protein
VAKQQALERIVKNQLIFETHFRKLLFCGFTFEDDDLFNAELVLKFKVTEK